jgi:flagellar assembly factor FliW
LGPFELGALHVIHFPAGIPGFEGCRRFVLLVSEALTPLSCLQSLDPPEPSFVTVDPAVLVPNYDFTLRELERRRLGAAVRDRLLWLASVTVTDCSAKANLRAPFVINPDRMLGCQFIRENDAYPVGFPIELER